MAVSILKFVTAAPDILIINKNNQYTIDMEDYTIWSFGQMTIQNRIVMDLFIDIAKDYLSDADREYIARYGI